MASPSAISNAAQLRWVMPVGFNIEVGVIDVSQPKNIALRSGLLKLVVIFTIIIFPSLRTTLPRYTSISRSGGGLSLLARRVGDGASMSRLIDMPSTPIGHSIANAPNNSKMRRNASLLAVLCNPFNLRRIFIYQKNDVGFKLFFVLVCFFEMVKTGACRIYFSLEKSLQLADSRRVAHLAQGFCLNLADTLARDVKLFADFFKSS